jgi:hypothetical protein
VPGVEVLRDLGDRLAVIGPPSAITAFDVAVNEAGLGIFAGASASLLDNRLGVLDLSSPTNTGRVLNVFDTPGQPPTVTFHNGLAYLPDFGVGLTVVNVRDGDRRRVPPTVALNTSLTPGRAEPGRVVRVTADAHDDTAVAKVEFYVDGALVATDHNFPFEYWLPAPTNSATGHIIVQAKATDLGGNSTFSDSLTLVLVADATPPRPVELSPAKFSANRAGAVSHLVARFAEALNPATVSATTFRLFNAGPDGLTGTADDVLVSGGTVSYSALDNTTTLAFAAPLPVGTYRAVLSAPLADASGNALTEDFLWSFTVKTPVSWARDADGFWDAATNWSGGTVPRTGDLVVIDRPGTNITVTVRSLFTELTGLESTESIFISAGGFNLRQPSFTRSLVMSNGLVVAQQRLTVNGDFTLAGQDSRVDGLGDWRVEGQFNWFGGILQSPGRFIAAGGMSLSGSASKNLFSRTLVNLGQATWSGSGHIAGSSSAGIINQPGAIFEIQNDAAFNANLGGFSFPTFDNFGTLRKVGGTNISAFNGVAFTNSGLLEIKSGTLNVTGGSGFTQTANGALSLDLGALAPGTGFGRLTVNGPVNLAGTLNLALVNGYQPNLNDSFSVLTGSPRSGTFTTVNGLGIGNGKRFQTNYTSSALSLQVVPAP